MVFSVSHSQSKFKALFACHDYSELKFCSQRCQVGGKDTLDGKISPRETGVGVGVGLARKRSLTLLFHFRD